MGDYRRYVITSVTITGHEHYGVIVIMPSGEAGWIESEYLDDVRVAPENWPAIGSVVEAVVLGPQTRDGRWRLCTRPSCFAEARTAAKADNQSHDA
jgi:hypothetical protein